VQAAVDDEEDLTVAELSVDDAGQVDTRFTDEIPAELDTESGLRKDRRQPRERFVEEGADTIDVDRLVAGKIGDAEPAAEIAMRQRNARFLGEPRGQQQRLRLSIGDGLGIERLAAGEDV